MKKLFFILVFCAAGFAQSGNNHDSDFVKLPSEFKQQSDSILSTLKRTGNYIAEKAQKLIEKISPTPDSLKNDAASLKRTTKEKFYKLTRDIKVPVITPDSLKACIHDSNLILLDIREETEQNVSMLPGAYSTKAFQKKFRHYANLPQKRIVAYCTIGVRSGKYAEKLLKMGLQVQNLEGGILGWTHINGPVFRRGKDGSQDTTKSVHVYSKGWNTLNPDYKAIW